MSLKNKLKMPFLGILILSALMAGNAFSKENTCVGAGPQTPRDITSRIGTNRVVFPVAPDYENLNLCNIHAHKNAEHKGPDFNIFVGDNDHGGYACNATTSLTKEQLTDPFEGKGAFKGVKPGDTIEVHWVYSSCNVKPGEGLGSCLTEKCKNPKLRVETQVFLLVNDDYALDFANYTYDKESNGKFKQAKKIPSDTGKPVVFLGSTTEPSYDDKKCSPLKVTWSVRPQCAKLNIASLHKWADKGNPFNETKAAGVRQLVTKHNLLSTIE